MLYLSEKPIDRTVRRGKNGLFWLTLLASASILAALAVPALFGLVYTHDDLGAFHLPVRAFYARQLSVGQPFDWMPSLYSGFYLTGEGQAGTYHPFHWVIYRFLPLGPAWTIELLASYPFMLVGVYVFLRRRLVHRGAAVFGGLTFAFSGFNLLHFVHPNAVAVIAHTPWLLWTIDVLLTEYDRRMIAAAQAGIAVLTASQILLGYPQYVWFSFLAEAAYAVFVISVHQRNSRLRVCAGHQTLQTDKQANSKSRGVLWMRSVAQMRACWPVLTAKFGGLLLGGIQWLPTLDALCHSVRRVTDTAFANSGSLHPLNLIQLVAPYLFVNRVVGQNTHELGVYLGAVPLVLIVWVIVDRRSLGRLRPLAFAAAVFGLLAILMAFGQYAPIYRLQRVLPIVGDFRCPCRYIALVHLSTAVLSALGLAILLRRCRRSQKATRRSVVTWRSLVPIAAVVLLSAVVAVAGLFLQGHAHIASSTAVLAGPLLIGAAAGLVVLSARGVRWAPVVLIILAAADLGFYGLSYSAFPHMRSVPQVIAQSNAPPEAPRDRVMADVVPFMERGQRAGSQILLAGWHRADGYAGLDPTRQLNYGQTHALRAAGVRWVAKNAHTIEIDGLKPCGEDWLEVPEPLPRVRMVSRAQASGNPANDIARLPIESAALIEYPLALPPGPPGVATILNERPGRFHIRVHCSTGQLLVIAEAFHPGWQAEIDGRPQSVWRTNGDFMGCPVEAGTHEVTLEFCPVSLRNGRIVSCFGLVFTAFCFASVWRVRPLCTKRTRAA